MEQTILQREAHDCGVACVAMVTGCSYEDVKHHFECLGYHQKDRPYSSNFNQLKKVLKLLGFNARIFVFRSWDELPDTPVILKVSTEWQGKSSSGNWHWVASKKSQVGRQLLDPCLSDLILDQPNFDLLENRKVSYHWFELRKSYFPYGCYIMPEKI